MNATTVDETAAVSAKRAEAEWPTGDVAPVRHVGRWVTMVAGVLVAAVLIQSIATNPNFDWPYVVENLTAGPILQGLLMTLLLTAISMSVGIVLGGVLAIMRVSKNPVARTFAWLFIGFFRGTPVLVQIIFWFNIAILIPRISIGVPYGPQLWEIDVNQLVTPMIAAILALGLNEAAYMAEIIRGGLLAVPHGQQEAASALGLSRGRTLSRIILPQAMRVIVPAAGNETIGMLKATALVSVIAVSELLYSVQAIYSQNYRTIPMLIVASVWYLIVTTLLTIGQGAIGRYYGRGFDGTKHGFVRRFVRNLNPTQTRKVR